MFLGRKEEVGYSDGSSDETPLIADINLSQENNPEPVGISEYANLLTKPPLRSYERGESPFTGKVTNQRWVDVPLNQSFLRNTIYQDGPQDEKRILGIFWDFRFLRFNASITGTPLDQFIDSVRRICEEYDPTTKLKKEEGYVDFLPHIFPNVTRVHRKHNIHMTVEKTKEGQSTKSVLLDITSFVSEQRNMRDTEHIVIGLVSIDPFYLHMLTYILKDLDVHLLFFHYSHGIEHNSILKSTSRVYGRKRNQRFHFYNFFGSTLSDPPQKSMFPTIQREKFSTKLEFSRYIAYQNQGTNGRPIPPPMPPSPVTNNANQNQQNIFVIPPSFNKSPFSSNNIPSAMQILQQKRNATKNGKKVDKRKKKQENKKKIKMNNANKQKQKPKKKKKKKNKSKRNNKNKNKKKVPEKKEGRNEEIQEVNTDVNLLGEQDDSILGKRRRRSSKNRSSARKNAKPTMRRKRKRRRNNNKKKNGNEKVSLNDESKEINVIVISSDSDIEILQPPKKKKKKE